MDLPYVSRARENNECTGRYVLDILGGNLLRPAQDVVARPRHLRQHRPVGDRAVGPVEDKVVRHGIDLHCEERLRVGLPALVEDGAVAADELPRRNEAGVEASRADDHVKLLLVAADRFHAALSDALDWVERHGRVGVSKGLQVSVAGGETPTSRAKLQLGHLGHDGGVLDAFHAVGHLLLAGCGQAELDRMVFVHSVEECVDAGPGC